MNLSQQNKKELFRLKKTAFIIVGLLLLIQLWFIWGDRKQMSIDYSFLYEETSTVSAVVFSVNEFTKEREGERGEVSSNQVYEYNYRFFLNGVVYKGEDITVFDSKNDGDTPFNIRVEYLNNNPNINRISDFVYIKNGFDFFKEYFMVKIIIMFIVIIYLVYNYIDEKKKMIKQEKILNSN